MSAPLCTNIWPSATIAAVSVALVIVEPLSQSGAPVVSLKARTESPGPVTNHATPPAITGSLEWVLLGCPLFTYIACHAMLSLQETLLTCNAIAPLVTDPSDDAIGLSTNSN